MKKAKLLLALTILTTGLVGYFSNENLDAHLGAQILSSESAIPKATTNIAPKSPDLLNTFNMYAETKSELALLEKYSKHVQGVSPEMLKEYQTEILSFVDRMLINPKHSGYLPMWPEHNVATYGNTLTYLFPGEANPLVYARSLGFAPSGAKNESYLSRADFMYIVGRLFVKTQRDPATVFAELGFIDSEQKWMDETKNGFPLVEGIRFILDIRDLIERKNIQASKQKFSQNLSYLADGNAEVNDGTITLLSHAFAAEMQKDLDPTVLENMKTAYKARHGGVLNASAISGIRTRFYEEMKMEEAPLYVLPELQLIGDCTNEAFRKTYMGPVAMTGPGGANIICDKVMIHFPENSYLINVFSLPKIAALEMNDQLGLATIRTDVMRSYENTLVVNQDGEQSVTMILRPQNLTKLLKKQFGLIVEDQEGKELVGLEKAYTDQGGVLTLRLRSFKGDHIARFKYAL